MHRQNDVLELLNEVKINIIDLEKKINDAKSDSHISNVLKPKVKTSLEHLRSCLDFCAKDIFSIVLRPKLGERNVSYFPYGSNKEEFLKSLKKHGFLLLKNYDAVIYSLVESIQPHECRNNWLYNLCRLTNSNKHDRLSTQKRLDGLALTSNDKTIVHVDNTSTVVIQNSIFDGKYVERLVLDKGQVALDGLIEDGLSIIDWTEFVFKDSGINIIELITRSSENIDMFQTELYKLLNGKRI